MSKKSNLERVRNKFEAERSKVKREYEILEERIRNERDKRLADSEREFRKEFGVAVKELLGKDYEWLIQWLMKNKEKEVEEAEKSSKNVRADELRKISPEDYLFRFLSNPELEKWLNESRETNNQEDSSRLVSIVMKLRLEKAWVEGTLL